MFLVTQRCCKPHMVLSGEPEAPVARTSVREIDSCFMDYQRRALAAVMGLLAVVAVLSNYPIPSGNGTAIVVICTGIAAVLLWRHLLGPPFLQTLMVAVAVGVSFLARDSWSGGVGIALLLAFSRSKSHPAMDQIYSAVLFAITFVSFVLIFDASGFLWQYTSEVSWWLTYRITGLIGEAERLAPGASVLPWLLFAWAVWFGEVSQGRDGGTRQARMGLVLLVGSFLSLMFQQELLAQGLTSLTLFANRLPSAISNCSRSYHRMLAAVACGLIFASMGSLVAYGRGWHQPIASSRVLGILDAGLMTLSAPDRNDFTTRLDAHFGGFERLMAMHGWNTTHIPPEFTSQQIEPLTILMVINPTEHFTSTQREAIESFVYRGGRLLVLGDHTDIGGTMRPLNQLLEFTSIEFNFDSAVPLDAPGWKWRNSLRGGFHPFFNLKRNDSLGISVGATLDVGSDAQIVVVGEKSFADDGRPEFGESRLGDLAYSPGESRGGLPLVAEQRVGAGVVQVWGDTAGFQTLSITRTGRHLISNLELLARRLPPDVPKTTVVFLAGGFVLLALIVFRRNTIFLFGALLVGVTTIGFGSARVLSSHPTPLRSLKDVAVLDASHDPSYPNNDDPKKSLTRLSDLFYRTGTILVEGSDFVEIIEASPQTWVIVAPNRTYSEAEASRLSDYVRGGGRLILVGGHEHRSALANVLVEFSLDIEPSIYGPAHRSRLVRQEWRSSVLGEAVRSSNDTQNDKNDRNGVDTPYPAEIHFKESYPILAGDAQPLVTCWGRPIAVAKKYGMGSLILIADSRFVNNENLQYGPSSFETIDERNARFLYQCLAF